VFGEIKNRPHKAFLNKRKNKARASEMKRSFCEHGVARQQRLRSLPCDLDCPAMVRVTPVPEGDQKSRVRSSFQFREKPLRRDKSGSPPTEPPR